MSPPDHELPGRLRALETDELLLLRPEREAARVLAALGAHPWSEPSGADEEPPRMFEDLSELALELCDGDGGHGSLRARWFFLFFRAFVRDVAWLDRCFAAAATSAKVPVEEDAAGDPAAASAEVFFVMELLERLVALYEPLLAFSASGSKSPMSDYLATKLEELVAIAPFQSEVTALAQRLAPEHPLRARLPLASGAER